MCRRMMYVLLVLALGLAPVVQGARIIWVSDNKGYNFDEGVPADQGFIDLLTAQGHEVDYKGQYDPHEPGNDEAPVNPEWHYWRELDPNKIAELNAADLVIIGRNADSGSYDDANEPAEWNSVTTPMIMLSAHIARSNKWGWLNGTGTTYTKEVRAVVADASHPIFAGVTVDANGLVEVFTPDYNVDCVTGVTKAGNGTLLATRADNGLVSIATWEAGQVYFEGSAHVAGGPRMFFAAGSGSKSNASDGIYNLTADGEKMFLNAVAYMLNRSKQIVFVSFHGADDEPGAGAIGAGFTEAPDKAYTDLLADNGYDVTRFITTKTPDVNVLNAADLVIVSRSVNSGHYSNDAATTWNTQVTAPMIILGGYPLRNSRMGFTTGKTMVDTTGDIRLTASNPNHPIFAGIALTDGTMDNPYAGVVVYPTDETTLARGVSINTDPANAAGAVLATIAAPADPNDPANGPVGGMVIGEWPAGAALTHNGGAGTDILAGRRLVFLTGAREASGISSETAGLYDLYEDGAQMLLNAVAYMLIEPPIVENGSFELPGTDKFKAWDGEKAGEGGAPATDIPGWSSDSTPVDSGVETGWGPTDGEWTAFLKGADPSVWQLTHFIMGADDVIELKVDAKNNWQATTLQLSMYIEVMGVRITVAAAEVALTDAMQEFTLPFVVQDDPLAAGMKLGVEFANVSANGESWIGLDNVRVEVK